jgi:hypothetical protein
MKSICKGKYLWQMRILNRHIYLFLAHISGVATFNRKWPNCVCCDLAFCGISILKLVPKIYFSQAGYSGDVHNGTQLAGISFKISFGCVQHQSQFLPWILMGTGGVWRHNVWKQYFVPMANFCYSYDIYPHTVRWVEVKPSSKARALCFLTSL